MPQDRFFHPSPFTVGDHLTLEEEEFRHLSVMRIHETETIELVNGKGQLAKAIVDQITKKNARLHITSLHTEERKETPLILAQGLPRQNRLDPILEKGTELGATEFWLFPAALSEKKEVNIQRANTILIAAMKQSGRLFLPEIRLFPSMQTCPLTAPAYFGDLSPEAPPLSSLVKKGPTILFIGPEKGFSESELKWLKDHAQGVKLHRNILRTDTAAIAALAIASQNL